MSEEEEEDAWDPKPLTTDTKEQGEESEDGARQTDLEEGVEPDRRRCSWDWEAVMEGSQGLAYDDPRSDSDAMMMGADCLLGTASSPPTRSPATPHMLRSPMDQLLPMETVEVHVNESRVGGRLSRRPVVGLHIAGEDTNVFCSILLQKLIVEIRKNKAIVGSSRRHMPKYVGEGVALCRTPSALGVLWPWFSCSTAVFRQVLVGTLWTRCIQSTSSYFQMLHR